MKTKNQPSNLVFYLCFVAYTCIYIARLNLSMASPAMREAGILTAAQLGLIGSASIFLLLGQHPLRKEE